MSDEIEEIKEAKVYLLAKMPFFASLLMIRLKLREVSWMPTAATDSTFVWYNPDYLRKLPIQERATVFAHEIMHAMLDHPWLMRVCADRKYVVPGYPYFSVIMNYAQDYIINDLLLRAGMKLNQHWLHDTAIATGDDDTITIYCKLYDEVKDKLQQALEKQEEQGQGDDEGQSGGQSGGEPGDEPGEGEGQPDPNTDGDWRDSVVQRIMEQLAGSQKQHDQHMRSERMDEHEKAVERGQWEQAVMAAKAAAKAQGKLPGSFEEAIDKWLAPKVDWRKRLRARVTRTQGKEARTWAKPYRRQLVYNNIYVPGFTGHNMGKLVIAADTSGSMTNEELGVGFGVVWDIARDCRPEELIIIWCDSEITDIDIIREGDDWRSMIKRRSKAVHGRGGTSFYPPFEWVKKQGFRPDHFIYFTDMYASFPEQPKYPVTWVATSDKVAPWGETLRLDMGDLRNVAA